ncbi:MAG: hypothetical protein K2O18_09475, partial [Oscillospiraceae bacterium]|nr:hypothetical protein [Oscillospiraceae bacterium]
GQIYDTAVIDEAQMIADPSRGAAWTAPSSGYAQKIFMSAWHRRPSPFCAVCWKISGLLMKLCGISG